MGEGVVGAARLEEVKGAVPPDVDGEEVARGPVRLTIAKEAEAGVEGPGIS